MPHYSRVEKVVIDVPESVHDATRDFWQDAVGRPMRRFAGYPEFHGLDLLDGDFGIVVQKLGEGPPRVHVDIHTDDLEAELARLEAIGAAVAVRREGWAVMRDPAGLPFCVLPCPAGSLTDENAQRWD